MAMESLIYFDDANRVRLMPVEQSRAISELQTECAEFSTGVEKFQDVVGSFVEAIEKQAQAIEREKMKAVGRRIKLEGESEARRRAQTDLRAQIKEKQLELDRLISQSESLERVLRDQQATIDRLSNNEA